VPPCERKNEKIKHLPLETGASRGAIAYLKVEKPRFLFLEGLTGAVVAAATAAAALPDASATCAAPSVDHLAVGISAPAPGTCSSTVSAALGEGGAGSHLSEGACPPSLSSSSPSPDDEYSEVAGGESPCCSRRWYSSSLCSRRSCRRILRSLLRAARSCSRRCAVRARSGSGHGRVGPRGVHGHPLLGGV
jgi:hypothetical protein